MRRRQTGVTLVDLMVVVAVTGIVAAVALSNLLRHEVRTRLNEAIQAASPGKSAIEAYFQSHKHLPEAGSVRLDTQQAHPLAPSLMWNGTVLIVRVSDAVGSAGISGSIMLRPIVAGGQLVWICGGTVSADYFPENC